LNTSLTNESISFAQSCSSWMKLMKSSDISDSHLTDQT
jgi:hypothetical protein